MNSNSSTVIKRKFIVISQVSGRYLVSDDSVHATYTAVQPGEMFEELFVIDDSQPGQEQISLMSIDRSNVIVECNIKDCKEIGSFAAQLLRPVKDYAKRIQLVENCQIGEAAQLEFGSPVTVMVNELPLPGVVRYTGSIGPKDEIWFGVELPHHINYGNTDGSYQGRRYFSCPKDSAVFATLADLYLRDINAKTSNRYLNIDPDLLNCNGLSESDKIGAPSRNSRGSSPQPPLQGPSKSVRNAQSLVDHTSSLFSTIAAYGRSSSRTSSIGPPVPEDAKNRTPLASESKSPSSRFTSSGAVAVDVLEDVPVRLSSRVCCFNDEGGSMVGTVRWIGRLTKEGNHLVAGIEFDEPLGRGTGVYLGDQLFVTKPDHACFIPITSLMKLEDLQAMQNPSVVKGPLSIQSQPSSLSESEKLKPSYSQMAAKTGKSTSSAIPAAGKPSSPVAQVNSSRLATVFPPQQNGNQLDQKPPQYGARDPRVATQNAKILTAYAAENNKSQLPWQSVLRNEEHVTKVKLEKPTAQYDYRILPNAPSSSDDDFGRFSASSSPKIRAIPITVVDGVKHEKLAASRSSGSKLLPQRPSSPVHLRCMDKDTEFGKHRGIQGHKNSCYLDATLFGMFAFTNVFDEILRRPRQKADVHGYEEVQLALNDLIVKPLRNTLYVSCEDVMQLRELMDSFGTVAGLTNEEKDPEELLTSLLQQILKIDPLLKLTSGDANWYTLFVEKNQMNLIPTVQELLDESLVASDVRFKEIPRCLILQTPRSGAQYKMYRLIVPSPTLDITDAIIGYARSCCICQEDAAIECKDCYKWMKEDDEAKSGLSNMVFCRNCYTRRHRKFPQHKPTELKITQHFAQQQRVIMELFAVLCIKTSHYVTFAKDGRNMWYFVDSMADREGEGSTGFNIPEVRPCPEISHYLDPQYGHKLLMERIENNQSLPEPVNRFFEDGYLCMYQPKQSNSSNSLLYNNSQLVNTSSSV